MNIRMIIVLVIIICFVGNAYSQTVKKVGSKLSPSMGSFIQKKWCLVEYVHSKKQALCFVDKNNRKKFVDYEDPDFDEMQIKFRTYCKKLAVVKYTEGAVSFEVTKQNNTIYQIKPIMPNKHEIDVSAGYFIYSVDFPAQITRIDGNNYILTYIEYSDVLNIPKEVRISYMDGYVFNHQKFRADLPNLQAKYGFKKNKKLYRDLYTQINPRTIELINHKLLEGESIDTEDVNNLFSKYSLGKSVKYEICN